MKTKFLFLTLILFFSLPIFSVYATSSGPLSPGTMGTDSAVGTVNWVNSSAAITSNDDRATVALANTASYYLKATNFGFNIPSGATINGIEVFVEGQMPTPIAQTDNSVRLLQDGSFAGDNKAGTAWSVGADAITTYGTATNTWGLTWTASQINSSSFGVGISLIDSDNGFGFAREYAVDHITITVHYTEASTSSTTNPPKKVSYPSYTMNFSDGTGSLIAETILPGQVGYVNNYLPTTTQPSPSIQPPTPTPTTEPIPLPVTPQVSDVKQQIASLIQQLIQLLQAEILMMQGQ